MSRVLIIGCGEIGSRHLQAVCALPEVTEIEIVDGHSDALGRARVAEVSDRQPHIAYRWLPVLDEKASRGGDLCIVATRADIRCQVVAEIARKLSYRNFLIEKVVTQSVADYEDLIQLSEDFGLSIWVNFKKRIHDTHAHVKRMLNLDEPLHLSVIGGNHGLVTNGIHCADIFTFYDDATFIHPGMASIDPILHRTKRDLFDLSGRLSGSSYKCSQFTLSFAAQHMRPETFHISQSKYCAVVDDSRKAVLENHAGTEWQWKETCFEANWNISYLMRSVVSDILNSGKCQLPTLRGGYPAHAFILGQVKPYFDQLLGTTLEACPVT